MTRFTVFPRRRHSGCLPVAALLTLLLAACGGSGNPAAPEPAVAAPRVAFASPTTRTVFSDGSVPFVVSPALSSAEQLTCTVNGETSGGCIVDPGAGAVTFADLQEGQHEVIVEVSGTASPIQFTHRLDVVPVEVVVIGATPGGIAAAVAAARAGQPAAILEPTHWVGGMMSGGLTKTDIGPRGHEIIGGIAAEFFQRTNTLSSSRGTCIGSCSGYDFEPQVAERVFEDMIAEAGIVLERAITVNAVEKSGTRIVSAMTDRGSVAGQIFIDATYEGDLMALASIPYRLGREAQQLADPPDDPAQLAEQEDTAGTRRYRGPRALFVDPYVIPGDPSSGTLRYVEPRPDVIPSIGSGDTRVQAYNYRLCVTDDPTNRIPFFAPEGYDPQDYEASARVAVAWAATGVDLAQGKFNPERVALSRNRSYYKYDLNGGSTFSTDMTAPDMNQAYTEANEAQREEIRAAYRRYIQGLLYFWQTDPRFGGLNQKIERFGYCADEFVDRDGWPHQMYVRTSRRMVGAYIMNENDVVQNGRRPPITDPIGFGSYNIDVHTVRYFAAPLNWPDGVRRDAIVLEGFWIGHLPNDRPWPISYRSLIPRAEDATNFLNPVTPSVTHVAHAAIRMEPTFMIMGEAAGIAAALAIETNRDVQDISYASLRQRLLANGQRLVH